MTELRRAVAEHGRYLDRPLAEESPQWKQVIPYVVVQDGPLTFLMERTTAGGDPRLHRKASIGVGGHLNPVDAGEDPLQGGLRREWAEELAAAWEPAFELLGLLNDDSNPVGSVHLGVVFRVDAAGRPVHVRETDKLSGRMADASEVAAAWDRLETWSQLVAAELLGVLNPTSAG
jgi:predicted NUDIX family phosphoesterase